MIMSSYDKQLRKQLNNSNRPGINEFLLNLYNLVLMEIEKSKSVLEIGAGAGISKRFLSQINILRTDLFEFPESDVKGNINSHSLPYLDNSFQTSLGIDVLHHLVSPLDALKELKRITNFECDGKIVLIEPYVTLLSYPIYRIFHSEKTSNPWISKYSEPFISTRPEDGDQSLSRLLFSKKSGRKLLFELFPAENYRIRLRIFSVLSFFLTGGVNNPLPTPRRFVRMTILVENLIPQALFKILGSRCLIVIEKLE